MGGADRSGKARENIGNGGGLVNGWKHVDMKVPRKIERCNFQNRNFNLARIGNLVFVFCPKQFVRLGKLNDGVRGVDNSWYV